MAAFGAARTKDSFRQARYKRLTARRGPTKALIAVEHSIIAAIWHMLANRRIHRSLQGPPGRVRVGALRGLTSHQPGAGVGDWSGELPRLTRGARSWRWKGRL
ncbi:hypothetical protein ACWGQ5_19025 [Streptomyces sp. NPDC055722]